MKAYITSDEVIEFLLTIPEGRLITPEDIARHFGTVELPYEPYWKRGERRCSAVLACGQSPWLDHR